MKGYNLKFIGNSDPDIHKSINIFKSEETNATLNFYHALENDPPPAKHSQIEEDEKLFQALRHVFKKAKLRQL